MATKTIKIPVGVHTEMKVFVAQHPELNLTDFAGQAIMRELADLGHKFVLPKKQPKKK